jgi:hypothetical protein
MLKGDQALDNKHDASFIFALSCFYGGALIAKRTVGMINIYRSCNARIFYAADHKIWLRSVLLLSIFL